MNGSCIQSREVQGYTQVVTAIANDINYSRSIETLKTRLESLSGILQTNLLVGGVASFTIKNLTIDTELDGTNTSNLSHVKAIVRVKHLISSALPDNIQFTVETSVGSLREEMNDIMHDLTSEYLYTGTTEDPHPNTNWLITNLTGELS